MVRYASKVILRTLLEGQPQSLIAGKVLSRKRGGDAQTADEMITLDCLDRLWLLVWLAGVIGQFCWSSESARDFLCDHVHRDLGLSAMKRGTRHS